MFYFNSEMNNDLIIKSASHILFISVALSILII